MKHIPIPFVLVVVATLALTIFFGAWAVSADIDAGDSEVAAGFVGASPYSGTIGQRPPPEAGAGEAGAGDTAGEDGSNAKDTWWGSVVLKACPFH